MHPVGQFVKCTRNFLLSDAFIEICCAFSQQKTDYSAKLLATGFMSASDECTLFSFLYCKGCWPGLTPPFMAHIGYHKYTGEHLPPEKPTLSVLHPNVVLEYLT